MLRDITPVVLTYNEERNIRRTLERLRWAPDVVVVDSGSTDDTLSIMKEFGNVRVFCRLFDNHANQWRYAVTETSIVTSWVLRLDADYFITDELITEIEQLSSVAPVNAYRIAFDYVILSRRLRSSLYPPNTILLRCGKFAVRDNGHTEAWVVEGSIGTLRSRILHDDRKSSEFWLNAQARYMKRDLKMITKRRSGIKDWVRLRPPLAPLLIFFYCLFGKGLIFNGRAGLFYALQRMVAEATLSLMLLESELLLEMNSDRNKEPLD